MKRDQEQLDKKDQQHMEKYVMIIAISVELYRVVFMKYHLQQISRKTRTRLLHFITSLKKTYTFRKISVLCN